MKKTINFIMAVVFLHVTTIASASTLFNSNSADFGSYGFPTIKTMPNGTGVAVGGNYELKLKRSSGTKPIIAITGPSITMGCGGLSIRGMFMSFLGLDELQSMLSDSGTTFAWGIMLGLIQSLPGVSETLAKIQDFARKIQALLANACNAGKILGQNLRKKASTDAVDSLMGGINNLDQDFAKKIKDANSYIDKVAGELLSSGSISDDKKTEAALQALMPALGNSNGTWDRFLYSYMNTNNIDYFSFIDDIAMNVGTSGWDKTVDLTHGKLKIKESVELPYSPSVADVDKYRLYAGLLLLMQRYGLSDVNVYKASVAVPAAIEVIEAYASAITSGDKDAGMKAANVIKKLFPAAGSNDNTDDYIIVDKKNYNKSHIDALVKFLDSGLDATEVADFKVSLPTFTLYSTNGKDDSYSFAIISQNDSVKNVENTDDWAKLIMGFGNVNDVATAQVECLTMQDNNATTTVSVNSTTYNCASLPPVFMNDAKKMLRVYAQSTPEVQSDLKTTIILRNKILLLGAIKSALYDLKGIIFANNGSSPISTGSKQAPTIKKGNKGGAELTAYYNKFLENVEKKVKETNEEWAQGVDRDKRTNFSAYLDNLDSKNKQRALQGVQR